MKRYVREANIKKPTKKVINDLIEAYALKIYSQRYNASIQIQQRFFDKFEVKLNAFESKYLDGQSINSDNFNYIKIKADEWWNSQAVRGPGKHW